MARTRTSNKLLLGFLLAVSLPAQSGKPPSLRWFSQALQGLVEQAGPAVVQVRAEGLGGRSGEAVPGRVQTERGGGAGVVVDPEGYIVTNAHVVGSSTRIQVVLPERNPDKRYASILKPAGKLVDAELVGLDSETDIAVLKVAGTQLPALKLGDSGALRQGELVLAAGSPFGLQNSVTMGVVSSVARQVRPDDPMIYIQTDAPINPGSSGGPLLNADGEVVGISTFIVSESGGNVGVGFAVPSSIVRTVYEQIRKHGRVRRGQVGLVVQTITPGLAAALGLANESGAIVADVVPLGPAAIAGIEIKDVILTLDGKPIENARQFGVNIYQKADQTVTLEIQRRGEKKSLQVAVLERPKDPDRLMSLVRRDQNLAPRLGILAVDLDEKVTPLLAGLRRLSGAVIVGALQDGAGAAAGLRAGDVVYEINNRPVKGLKDLMDAEGQLKAGQPVVLYIERSGQFQFVQVEIE
jgi:serine protease Do